MPHRPRHILLLVSTEFSYGRDVVMGVMNYAQASQQAWILRQFAPDGPSLRAARQWKPHGIIGHLHDPAVSRSVRGMKLPTVDFSSRLHVADIAHVRVDDRAIGGEGARYFLDRGFTHFGFAGFPNVPFSEARQQGFLDQLHEAGQQGQVFHYSPQHIHAPTNLYWTRELRRLGHWLKRLPKPVAILAANDRTGVELTDACRGGGMAVPDDVAIVVVNNDDLLCQIADPPLSSIISPMDEVGYEAARILARMLEGEAPPDQPLLLQPRGVVTRKSSDVLAADDPVVASALRFMHRCAEQPINVEDVLEHVHVSRSLLERKFRAAIGRTPLAELRRLRLQRARVLLTDTNLPMPTIATRCGFSSAVRFSTVFRQLTGQTPTACRAESQRLRRSR
ncbi:MAG: substrate-binding domain-containing protein [Phycisphaeraceae bacterium]